MLANGILRIIRVPSYLNKKFKKRSGFRGWEPQTCESPKGEFLSPRGARFRPLWKSLGAFASTHLFTVEKQLRISCRRRLENGGAIQLSSRFRREGAQGYGFPDVDESEECTMACGGVFSGSASTGRFAPVIHRFRKRAESTRVTPGLHTRAICGWISEGQREPGASRGKVSA